MNRFSIANPPDHIVFLANELRRVDQRTYRGFIGWEFDYEQRPVNFDLYREEMEEDPNLMTIEVSGPWYSVSLTTGAVSIIERGDHLGDLEIDVLSRLKDAGFDLSDECLYPTWTAYRDEAQRVGHLLQGRGESSDLGGYLPLAKTGNYPGRQEIEDSIATLRKFVEETDSLRFLKRFVENKSDLLDLADDYHDLKGFYTNQKHSWEKLRGTVDQLAQNRLQLEQHEAAGPAFARMEEILATARPYNLLHEAADLIHTATTANDALVAAARKPAVAEIQGLLDGVAEELDKVSADATLRDRATEELTKLRDTAQTASSIAHIAQARQTAEAAFDRALTAIEQAQTPPQPPTPGGTTAPTPPKPKVKKRRVVEPKSLWTGGFIESPADIETFLTKLREELEAALAADERVQIK